MKQRIVFVSLLFAALAFGMLVKGYIDLASMSAPASPDSGRMRLYADSGTGKLACKDSAGANCMPSGSTYSGPSTQNVYTSSGRAFGTTYHNTTGVPVYVAVTGYSSSGTDLYAKADTATTPTTFVTDIWLPNTSKPGQITFLVKPGDYYTVYCSSCSINTWIEWY